MTSLNHEFGGSARTQQAKRPDTHLPDPDLLTLVERVRGFDHDNATPDDQMVLVQALRTIADDTVARFDHVLHLQRMLESQLQTAKFCAEVSEVVARIKPTTKRSFWGR